MLLYSASPTLPEFSVSLSELTYLVDIERETSSTSSRISKTLCTQHRGLCYSGGGGKCIDSRVDLVGR